jgi:TPR repeat protein
MLEAFIHHETGLGVPQDSARAFGYLEQAAEAGDPRALYNMGAYCATGRMVRQDMAEAAKWYRKAADAGHIKALATLAVMYATGDGVAQDTEHAAELFDEAEYLGLDVEAMRESVGL